ncbi:Gfo/Idh/MocA family protein [Halosolutus gelatinilyticus]|uniref:Gfo/Idh/MocA family protein n=1 Tax=Halosolutus gelatinilyticus TaxID=2931975 RepID=UPI001FF26943|nr:Gfo/Idh/MocA family oxidoreductase [Halosolutus gelatinilyticus]
MSTIDVGYIGLNHHHTEPYLESLAQLPVEVTCACEPDEEIDTDSVEGLGDVTLYRSPAALLEDESPDLIWVTLSNADAPGVIIDAVERGVDVFTEKPVARTADELRPVVDAARESDATVGVSYSWRGHPIAQELRDRVRGGFFGDVRAFEARFLASRPEFRNTDHYLFDPQASRGGIVQWLGIHWIDLLPWILGDQIERVNAALDHRSDAIDVEDGGLLQLETASGAIGTLHCGYYLREGRYDTNIAVYGDEGRAEWDPIGATFGFDGQTTVELASTDDSWNGTPQRTITYDYEPTSGYGGEWGLEFLRAFLDAVENDRPVPVSLEDAASVLEVLDAVYASAGSGEWESVGDDRRVALEQD